MLRVEPSLFSNVVSTVQRTGSLPGGALRALPNGVIIDGLQGVNSFGSEISDAHKEFKLGRVRTALDRVKQIELQFNGIAGRWNSTVGSVISSARQGNQKLPLQKLNEVKSAQTKMQLLVGPANKAFRDLVLALEHAVAMEGRTPGESERSIESKPTDSDNDSDDRADESDAAKATPQFADMPDVNSLGNFALHYRFGEKLQLLKGPSKKMRIEPKLEISKFYFFEGFNPPRVVRLRNIERQAVTFLDVEDSREIRLSAIEIKSHIECGAWMLKSKQPVNQSRI